MTQFTGSSDKDTFTGTADDDRAEGLDGSDTLYGRGGADTLLGGNGDDYLYGFKGSSGLDPNQEDRADSLDGGGGHDTLRGNSGDDTLLGGDGDDNLRGDAGNDLIDGGAGSDFVAYRFDQLGASHGFSLDFSATGGTPSFTLADGQGGTDTLTGIEILGVFGSAHADLIVGSNQIDNYLEGDPGDDTLRGGLRNDSLWGDQGDDLLQGGAGNDQLVGEAGSDSLEGGAGNDTLYAGWDSTVSGTRGSGVDSLNGGDGDDLLAFSMDPTKDRALMAGGAGADTFEIRFDMAENPRRAGSGLDRVLDFNAAEGDRLAARFYSAGEANLPTVLLWSGATDIDFLNATQAPQSGTPVPDDLVRLWTHVSVARNETLVYGDANGNGLIDSEDLLFALDGQHALGLQSFMPGSVMGAGSVGTAGADLMQGDDGDNALWAAGGSDTLLGAGGNDVLAGGSGSDSLNGGDGNDTLYGGYEDLDVDGVRSNSRDTLDGGAGDDLLRLTAGDGSDHYELRGGSGADRFVVDLKAVSGAVVSPTALDQVLDFNAAEGDKLKLLLDIGPESSPVMTHLRWMGQSGIDFASALGQNAPSQPEGDFWDLWVHHDATQQLSTLFIDLERDGRISANDYMLHVHSATALTAQDFLDSLDIPAPLTDGAGDGTLWGGAGADTLIGNDGHDALHGQGGNDELDGGAGNDTLDGGSGDDLMTGGLGHDLYIVDSAGDRVVELADGGIDVVYATRSYTLEANVEQAVVDTSGAANLYGNALDNLLIAGAGNNTLYGAGGTDLVSYARSTAAVNVDLSITVAQNTGGSGTDTLLLVENLIGSNHADRLTGNSGWNYLDGGAGDDTLTGGAGNDTYMIDSALDRVVESADATVGGNGDWIQTWLASTTLGTGIENGHIFNTGNATLYGNALNNILISGNGNNTLYGSGGVDTASYVAATGAVQVSLAITTAQNTGASGMDTITLIENLTGSSFADRLTGNSSWNVIDGGNGADTIDGGLGGDLLRGGYGTLPDGAADVFVFSTRLDARLNLDRVISFEADAMDRIQLDPAVFASLGATLDASEFRLGTRALDADDFILFDPTTGLLRYDADGNGTGAAVAFAKLDGMLGTLDSSDFVVLRGGGG